MAAVDQPAVYRESRPTPQVQYEAVRTKETIEPLKIGHARCLIAPLGIPNGDLIIALSYQISCHKRQAQCGVASLVLMLA